MSGKLTHTADRHDVMPSEVMALHTQMPYPSKEHGHPEYRQRHDARCYFCALLDALAEAEAEIARLKSNRT